MTSERVHISKIALEHYDTRICVTLPPDEQVRYIGKIGIPTQNVLAVCDFDMRFTYVSTGQPGAMHDTSVLYNALSVD
jgi:hypothetical protein